MDQGSVIHGNHDQTIRLPKAVAFPTSVTTVEVVAFGRARIITPVGESWDGWFDGVGVTTDFMVEREQSAE